MWNLIASIHNAFTCTYIHVHVEQKRIHSICFNNAEVILRYVQLLVKSEIQTQHFKFGELSKSRNIKMHACKYLSIYIQNVIVIPGDLHLVLTTVLFATIVESVMTYLDIVSVHPGLVVPIVKLVSKVKSFECYLSI